MNYAMNFDQDFQAQQMVTPFGQTGYVQQGVSITPLRGLKARLSQLADESEYDLNPEACIHPLKRRLRGR